MFFFCFKTMLLVDKTMLHSTVFLYFVIEDNPKAILNIKETTGKLVSVSTCSANEHTLCVWFSKVCFLYHAPSYECYSWGSSQRNPLHPELPLNKDFSPQK